MAQDIIFKRDEDGLLDLSEENNDFASTDGVGTSIVISLYTDKRTESGTIQDSFKRGGFSGNIIDKDTGFQLGSELWVLNQSRITQDTLNKASDYAYNCLTWMIDLGIVDIIQTPTEQINEESIKINVILYKDNNVVGEYYSIYKNTIDLIEGI
jgi:phage gp46-like protein